jgi:DNA-binding CsgD family transcriptional regulator
LQATFVGAPAFDRGAIERLAHLPLRNRGDGALVFGEPQAVFLEREAEEIEHSAQWAALGKSNGDIAVILSQSKRAIDWHMSEILRKLKVSSRNQAIALLACSREVAPGRVPFQPGQTLASDGRVT